MTDLSKLKDAINKKVFDDIDWMNAYWLDEIMEEFSDISEREIGVIYSDILKKKINSLPIDELNAILSGQSNETSANQNYLLQNLIEEKLGLTL